MVRVALLIAVCWVLDDAFWHREPGTQAGDHVVSGLVPATLAALAAIMYPHVRAGGRALIALTAAPWMIMAGVVDGARHIVIDRMEGGDLTAVLTGLAGLVLAAAGMHVLWRSRRRDGPPMRRWLRRGLACVGAGAWALFIVLPAAIAILATHRAREPVRPADLGRPHRTVSFATSGGLRLAGWYVPSRNRAAVIVSPGRRGPVAHARLLARHGYGVLLFDRRGEGESQGDFNAYGWSGAADLSAAVTFLRRQTDVDPGRIGGLGLSVGGEMLLQAAAEDKRLGAVVAEGASGRSVNEEWDDPGVSAWRKPFTPMLMQTVAVSVLSDDLPPPSLFDLVDDIAPRPILLIRGLEGQPTEVYNRTFARLSGERNALWEVPGAGHTRALTARPREYERRVVGFLDHALLGSSTRAGG